MPRHKQIHGITYQIISQGERQAVLEYTYLCPYCMRTTKVQSLIPASNYERLETGGFYDSLSRGECGKTADVRFLRTMRIE